MLARGVRAFQAIDRRPRRPGCAPPVTTTPGTVAVPRFGAEDARRTPGWRSEFEYEGEVDRAGKIAFLRRLDVLSVPATYDEPKGLFLLEAMAAGVPVVQPKRGAFTEVVERTGGGLLIGVDDPQSLAEGLFSLW